MLFPLAIKLKNISKKERPFEASSLVLKINKKYPQSLALACDEGDWRSIFFIEYASAQE